MKLTEKQEKFCREMAAGKKGVDAFRLAYGIKEASKNKVYNYVSRVMKNPSVQSRIAELKERREMDVKMLEEHMQRLRELRDAAMAEGSISAAIRAEIALGKASAAYSEKMKEEEKKEEKDVRIVLF